MKYPPKDHQEIIDGCTCPGRADGRHDLCCEWVLRGAGLLTEDITPEQITGGLRSGNASAEAVYLRGNRDLPSRSQRGGIVSARAQNPR